MLKCTEEKATLETELAECEAALATVESDAAAEVAVMRQDWQDIRDATSNLSAEVEQKDAELKQLEDENRVLNADLIRELGKIGSLIQVTRTDPEEETRQWLGCLDEKTTIELKVRMCQSKKDVAVVRARTQREHYRGLKDSAQQNKQMVEGRLNIVNDMIANAQKRKERLTAQVTQIKQITNGTTLANVSTGQTTQLLIDIDTSAAVESASTTSASECELLADREGHPFSMETSSNGVPAGCVRYDDGRVAFVETCRNQTNCCTAKCEGCTVLSAEACDDEERCATEALQANLPYSTEWLSDGAPAGCVRYDDGRVVYVQACVDHENCGTAKCSGCMVLFAATGSNLWSLLTTTASQEKPIAPLPSMLAYRLLNIKVNGSSPVRAAVAADPPRQEKLLNAKKAEHVAVDQPTKTTTSLRAAEMVKLDIDHSNQGIAKSKDVEPKGVVQTKEEEVDPVAEAKERLKTIDEEIKAQRKKVEAHGVVAGIAKDNMNAEAENQREVSKKLRYIKNKTMIAFQKAFMLDYKLDTMETLHDEAYVAAKNATRMYERASKTEHEAVAELQRLTTKKHRYLHIVATAEDAETEEAVRRANEEDKDRHSHARTIGLAVVILWSTNLFGSTST
jgi:hypothetical protein